MQLRVALVCLVLRNWIVGVLICIVYTDSDDVVSCGGDWLVLCCVEWMGFFNLNVTMHCLFSCSHNAHTHTHTAPPTSYCTSVPFSHCFCLLSPPGTDKPCCSGTQGGLPGHVLYLVWKEKAGLICTPPHLSLGEGLSQRPLLPLYDNKLLYS